jgi:hypothetical protein
MAAISTITGLGAHFVCHELLPKSLSRISGEIERENGI